MNPLALPYVFNILVLTPVGLLTLLGGRRGGQWVSQNKFSESEGFRSILGSLWTAVLLGSIIGLFYPVTMAPMLMLQVIYKSLWLVVFVLPRVFGGRLDEIPWGIASIFLAIVASYPWIIPWGHIFQP